MKGTFFSADFIKDSNEDLRLLELNTDTAILSEEADNIDWSGFFDILTSNSISVVDIIYKPYFHTTIVEHFSSSLATSLPGVNLNIHPEDINTIYPSSISDDPSKFILRLAYDEAAILDSEYCKGRLNLYKLFHSGSSTDLITEFYHSSSTGEYNTLSNKINPTNLPDVSIKDMDESFNPIDFYKIGHSELSDSDRWSGFLAENKAEDKLIEQFHYHSSSLDNQNRLSSYRSFCIVYGSNLDVLNLHSYKNSAIFDIPSDISSEVNDSLYTNKLADKHYYEYTTNTFKVDGAGLLSTNKIQMADGSYRAFTDIEVGDSIKSFFISGSPQVENDYDTLAWEIEGSSYPTGSFITSSAVVFKNTEDLRYNGLIEYVVDGDSAFSGTAKQFLVYDTGSNKTSYKHATELNPDVDFFFKADGELVDLDEVNYYITSDSDIKIVELDVEDTDTYIISGSTAFNTVVSHNAPCFVAGTKITLGDGTFKNIEDIEIGEEVLTYNFKTEKNEPRKVRELSKKSGTPTIQYTFSDGSTLHATHDHPLYSPDSGWVSDDPVFTSEKYNFKTEGIKEGTTILKSDGSVVSVTGKQNVEERVDVFNLRSVEVNHNFYANELLAHNRCFVAGTEITLANGDVKNIEDVNVGEEVLTFNEELQINVPGTVGDLKKHKVKSIIRLTLDNENIIHTTEEHPFYTHRGWVKAGELESLDVCRKVDGSESIISTVEKLEEQHTVYNLLSVSYNHNFFANGILVHNK